MHRIVRGAEPVGVLVVEAFRPDVPEQHPDRLVRGALEGNPEFLAHEAFSTVGADEIGGADGLAVAQLRRHALVVLVERDQFVAQFDGHVELGEPGAQDRLGPRLAQKPDVRVGHGR